MLAVTIAEGLSKCGIECTLCGLGNQGNLAGILADRGVTGISLSTPNGVSPGLMIRLATHFLRNRIDVVVTHHFRQLFHAVPAAFPTRTRLIHVEHDYHFYDKQPSLLPRLEFLLRFADAFVVVSDEIRDWFCKRLPHIAKKCIAIPNGVDTARFRKNTAKRVELRQRYSIGEDEAVIGTCARLEMIKNHAFLLDAFGEFHKNNPKSRLVIVGDGSLRPILEKQAYATGVADRVVFAGASTNPEDYLAAFDMYAITSYNEGLPLSVLEAMSSELPVVAVKVGSLVQVITDKTGILIERHDIDTFVKAFSKLAHDKQLAYTMGCNGRTLVLEKFSSESMINQYIELANKNCGVSM